MKKIITAICIVASLATVNAQNTFPASGSAGIGTLSPNASSVLDIVSTTKGMLAPRMTLVQRNAIATPAAGLLIYQTNSTPGFYYYTGTAWTALKTTAGWGLKGNAGTTSATNFIGTTDTAAFVLKTNNQTSGALSSSSAANTSYGYQALMSNTNYNNTAIGYNTLKLNTTAGYNTAIGTYSMLNNTVGYQNTAVGSNSLQSNQSGNYNVAFGYGALLNNTIGNSNVAVGNSALLQNTSGSDNIGIGKSALNNNLTGGSNIGIGSMALNANTSGASNIAVGSSALLSNDIGSENVAIGANALRFNLGGNNNAAIGTAALQSNINGSANFAFGNYALTANTNGSNNVAIGAQALRYNGASNNIAIGQQALFSNTVGNYNVAVGNTALYSNIDGSSNCAFGKSALYLNTSGNSNTAIGAESMWSNTTGMYNTAVGTSALTNNTSGLNNTAVGVSAMLYNSSGHENLALGTMALLNNTNGIENIAAGYKALYSNLTGYGNVANGAFGLQANTNGVRNIAIGSGPVFNNTSGSFNIGLGYHALDANTTGDGNIGIGTSSGPSLSNLTNTAAIGGYASVDASNKIRLGDNSVSSIGGQVGWTNFSDGRIKKDIKENVPGLEFINELRPVTYHFDLNKENEMLGINDSSSYPEKYDIEKIAFTGFIAQEVEASAKKINYDFSGVDKSGKIMGLRYTEFIMPMVKAIQELSNENKQLKNELNDIKTCLESLCNNSSVVKSFSNSQISTSSNLLFQNNPNPFNESTTISYFISGQNSKGEIKIFSMNGEELKSIAVSASGSGQVELSANSFAPGVYTYILIVDGKTIDTKQMVITK